MGNSSNNNIFIIYKMSSTLDRMVLVLTGVNYLNWATCMSAYLDGKGLLGHALGKIPKPAIPQSPASVDEISVAVSALNYWAGNDGCVMGTIVLKTHFMCESI